MVGPGIGRCDGYASVTFGALWWRAAPHMSCC